MKTINSDAVGKHSNKKLSLRKSEVGCIALILERVVLPETCIEETSSKHV